MERRAPYYLRELMLGLVVTVLGAALVKYSDLPTRISVVEARMNAVDQRMESMDKKLDVIIDRVSR